MPRASHSSSVNAHPRNVSRNDFALASMSVTSTPSDILRRVCSMTRTPLPKTFVRTFFTAGTIVDHFASSCFLIWAYHRVTTTSSPLPTPPMSSKRLADAISEQHLSQFYHLTSQENL